jgi:DNA-binding NarL/FixJ family response regulator
MTGGSVLIVDDNAEFRRLARRLLESGGYSVVGEADDGGGALRAHAALRPDIVLLDVQLPDRDGFAIAESLAADADPPIVVLISSRDRTAYRRKVAETTARAFLPKGELTLTAFDQAIRP